MASAKISQNDDEMTLGQRLTAAREEKGLALEKVAHDMRMRVQRIKDLEADDYTRFPHPSYARMFLKDYAKYLGIPRSEIKDLLPDPGECGGGGYSYIDELAGETVPVPTVRRLRPRRRLLPVLITGTSLILLALFALQVVIWVRKLDSLNLGAPVENAAERKPVEPAPVPTAVIADDVAVLNEPFTPPAPFEEVMVSASAGSETLGTPVNLSTPVAAPAPLLPSLSLPSAPAPAAAATPDERSAFFVGSGLDQDDRLH
jgi:cytoskeleton protein RodZ